MLPDAISRTGREGDENELIVVLDRVVVQPSPIIELQVVVVVLTRKLRDEVVNIYIPASLNVQILDVVVLLGPSHNGADRRVPHSEHFVDECGKLLHLLKVFVSVVPFTPNRHDLLVQLLLVLLVLCHVVETDRAQVSCRVCASKAQGDKLLNDLVQGDLSLRVGRYSS